METESPQTEVVISLPILRKDREGQYTKKVRELKAKMKKYCTQKNIKTIENENITEEGLGMKGLHLNKRGVAKLAHNFLDFLNNNSCEKHPTDQTSRACSRDGDNHNTEQILTDRNLIHHPDWVEQIQDLRKKHPKNVIISYLNINSIRNKFENIMDMIGNNIDVIIFGETKLDDSFPRGQFKIPGFKQPYRLDVTARSGGLMVLINENISSKTLDGIDIASDMQIIPIELNLRTKKWLLLPVYRPPQPKPCVF